MPRADAILQIGVTEQTYHWWRKKYGGIGTEQLKELKRLQKESEPMSRQRSEGRWRTRLRLAVSGLTLDKLILTEAALGVLSGSRSDGRSSGSAKRPNGRSP